MQPQYADKNDTIGWSQCKIRVNKRTFTYNPPNANMNINPIFCFVGNLRAENTGIGRVRMIKSVRIFIAALKNHKNFLLMHWAEGSNVQNPDTGMHVQIAVVTVSRP